MPRRKKRGVGPSTRGRHKKSRSRETGIWNRLYLKKSLDGKQNTEPSRDV